MPTGCSPTHEELQEQVQNLKELVQRFQRVVNETPEEGVYLAKVPEIQTIFGSLNRYIAAIEVALYDRVLVERYGPTQQTRRHQQTKTDAPKKRKKPPGRRR